MDLGRRLRLARNAAALSQEEVGQRLGVSKGSVSAWENDRNRPLLDQFAALCRLFAVSADSLLAPERTSAVRDGGTAPYVIHDGDVVARTPEEVLLLTRLRTMSAKRRRALLEFLGVE